MPIRTHVDKASARGVDNPRKTGLNAADHAYRSLKAWTITLVRRIPQLLRFLISSSHVLLALVLAQTHASFGLSLDVQAFDAPM